MGLVLFKNLIYWCGSHHWVERPIDGYESLWYSQLPSNIEGGLALALYWLKPHQFLVFLTINCLTLAQRLSYVLRILLLFLKERILILKLSLKEQLLLVRGHLLEKLGLELSRLRL